MAARSSSSRSASTGPRNDAYTGLLAISLIAQIVGVVFFYLDYSAYPTTKPSPPAGPTLSAPPPPPAPGGVAPPAGDPGAP